jgi:histidine triad (HIT) family protein
MTDRDPDCLFCKIVAGDIPSDRVYEDDEVIAFRDINPRAPTHLLVIPRRHVADAQHLTDRDGELLTRLFGAVRKLAEDAGLEGGYRVVTNVGPDAGQTVFHLHSHLLGGRSMSWPPG